MDATATRRRPIPTTTTPRATSSKIYKLELFPIHSRIWTRFSNVYQQLILQKAPTNEPGAALTGTPISTSPPQLPSTIAGKNNTPNGIPTTCGQHYDLLDRGKLPLEHPTEHRQAESNLQGTHGPVLQAGSRQGTAEDGDSVRNSVQKYGSQHDGLPSKVAVPPSIAPPTAAPILVVENVESPATTHHLVEIPFNEHSTEKLSKSRNCYMDMAAMIPDALNDEWSKNIKPKLDREVKILIQGMNGGKDNIHSTTQFNMVGTKHDDRLLAKPTIVISCGTKDCRRKLAERLNKLQLDHLVAFDHPIRIRYQPQPASWAASSTEELPLGESTMRLPNLQDVCIEQSDMPVISGLKMRFDVLQAGTVQQRYATVGGVIGIDEAVFIMTTAHTFLADMGHASEASSPDGISRPDPCSDSDSDADPAEVPLFSVPSPPHNTMAFASLWTSRIKAAIAYSFLGEVATMGNSTTFDPSSSDWALFEVLNAHPLLSKFATSAKMSSVIPAPQLKPGDVQILDTVSTRCTGFLTQTSASIHTGQAVMDVREVLLDNPLSSGPSGAWIVRENNVCGYVVAMAGSGRSCFMVTMEFAFREMETVHGKKVKLGRELRDLITKSQVVGRAFSPPPDMPENRVRHLGASVAHDEIQRLNNLETPPSANRRENTRSHMPKVGRLSILPRTRRRPDGLTGGSPTNALEFESYVGNFESGIPQTDPRNPKQWTPRKKCQNFLVICSLTFLNSFASTVIAPSVPLIMRDLRSSNHVLGCFIVSVYVFGQITGPLLLLPLSDIFGRCIVYHISNILFIIFNIGCSVAPSTSTLIGFRFLAGCAAACPFAIGYRSMEEMYPDRKRYQRLEILIRRHSPVERPKGLFKDRDQAAAALTIASMLGSSIGPVPGGSLAENGNWRLVFGSIAILGGLLEFLSWFWISETNERTILRMSMARDQNLTRYQVFRRLRPLRFPWFQAISRSARLLKSSQTVTILVLYLALMKGYMYLLYTTLTPIFTPNYSYATQWHLGPGKAGLAFLAIFIGSIIGSLFGCVLFRWARDRIDQKMEKSRKAMAQYKQLPLVPGSLLIGCGVGGFGWSVIKAKQLIVPLASTLWVSIGTSLTVLTIEAYLADIFVRDSADALNASNVLGSFIGGLLPLLGQALYVSPLGIEWTCTIYGIVALAILRTAWYLWRNGKYLNRNPTRRSEEQDLDPEELDEDEVRVNYI